MFGCVVANLSPATTSGSRFPPHAAHARKFPYARPFRQKMSAGGSRVISTFRGRPRRRRGWIGWYIAGSLFRSTAAGDKSFVFPYPTDAEIRKTSEGGHSADRREGNRADISNQEKMV